ncbi:phospholipid/cholesterol/gamma-HCH transport system substrate-binding protein [Saccharopolyspora antimicrobica]|uniref:Phospholipid/cholesterol/gamma-HCH transport system substrate-binding protein n=1 Tax=Saccharopolyspora antimicrobica TaxID=455193 RepID=A0A1I4RMZ9_9PSEU|nr:MlaD family protein [Saccharopolyspora antimicrobica]RKT87944.1 phospholipid/cholesterol/gamma-HCH transport system substrate-binding protein [Saccharopolyspora antimicrobica]SFM53618.1 phospholipid/cholesterol/gamma-HCH transport system substrate-binding protein [Saccharopolyspora antimicrobica]
MNRRLVLAQLALFLVISIACTYYVITNVAGPGALRDPVRVTVRLPDAASITPSSQVTYRGVVVGTVSEVRIDPGGRGVSVQLALYPGTRVPADSDAVISMATPLAVQTVDLQPAGNSGPYLRDGSVIEAERTRRPIPLDTLLVHFTELTEQLRPEDVAAVTEALSTGLAGKGPELTRILDNSAILLETAREHRPQLDRLVTGSRELAGSGDRIRELAAGLRSLTAQIRGHQPRLDRILDTAPGATRRLAELFARNDPATTALLGNLVTTGQIVAVRAPALDQLLISLPEALSGLGSVVHGDTADLYLIGTQGPICATATERRSPTAVQPREADLDRHCPADQPDLGQRGAANAPRPAMTTYDPATGQTPAGFRLGTAGGQATVLGPRSWYSVPLQGVR